MIRHRLLRLRHGHENVGFLSACLTVEDPPENRDWLLSVESPSPIDLFREFLVRGVPMSVNMVTRDGDTFRGEAYVSSLSEAARGTSLVALAGAGPLRPS